MPDDNATAKVNPEDTKTIVVKRDDIPKNIVKEEITTSEGYSNVRVKLMSAVSVVLVRTIRTFLQVLLASLIGVGVGSAVPVVSDALPPSAFGEKFAAALYIAALSALVTAIQNTIEIMAKIDAKAPEWRA